MQQDKEDNKEIAEIEDAIPANVNDILQELPEDKRNAVLATMMSIEEERTFSGPLPPPEHFEAYEKTLPGATDRIMTMTEKQVDHRIDMEKRIVKRKFNQATLGQILGTILIIFFGYIAYNLAMNSHDNAAIAIGVTTVISLAVVLYSTKYHQYSQRKIQQTIKNNHTPRCFPHRGYFCGICTENRGKCGENRGISEESIPRSG